MIESNTTAENEKGQLDEDLEIEAFLKREEKENARTAKKPIIDHLEDAIVLDSTTGEPKFLLSLNDTLVIERFTDFGQKPRWFDTKMYEVRNIDHDTGALRLVDLENRNFASSNYRTGFTNTLYRFKIAPKTRRFRKKDKNRTYVTDSKTVSESKTETTKTKKTRKFENGSIRTVYESRGVIHTRLSGVPYGPSGKTKANAKDRLKMSMNDNGTINVEDTASGWSETWQLISI